MKTEDKMPRRYDRAGRHALPKKLLRGFAVGLFGAVMAVSLPLEAAASPPSWAPAHGYRAKHKKHHHKHYRHDDYRAPVYRYSGADLGRCHSDIIGGVLGGATGAALGSQIGKGDGKTAAIIGGAIIGVLVGGSIGDAMDRADQACLGEALNRVPDGRQISWNTPQGERFAVTPTSSYRNGDRYCREYQTTGYIGGREEVLYGRACRQPDGSWERVK